MDAALGPPEKMADRREDLTPMMSQYLDLCEQYPDSLVLFQVGDFYETFCEAAERTARLLEITLTKREDSTGRYPMSGIPIDNAESYIETLLDAGYRVAVADQVQDPSETTGVVDRAVTRIVTPGTLTEDEFLDEDNNFVAGLAADRDALGLAVLDVSTGDFYATGGDREAVADELDRFAPAEAVVAPGVDTDLLDSETMVTPFRPDAFDREAAAERVGDYFGDPESLLAGDAEVRACGALLAYAEYTRAGESDRLDYLNHLTRYDPREYLLLDAVALRSLELFERRAVHGEDGATLFGTVDETASALGARRLKDWLRRPLLDEDDIAARHDAVEELVGDVATREQLHEDLRDVYDLERLISRVSRGRANARELRSLKSTLDVVPDLRAALADADSDLLGDLRDRLDPLEEVRDHVGRALREEPPIELTEGGLIREGYDDDLDALRETEREGKAWIDALEADERERTGIDSLKVGYNQVHGYYIEVTNPNLDAVPDDYQRRQTLKNSERFVTPELKEREEEIVTAEDRADDLEYRLFTDLRASVAAETERVQQVADAVAALDALQSLATVAAERDYCRPEIGGDRFDIEAGRHPVVERTAGSAGSLADGDAATPSSFVPNPTDLAPGTVAVITGPNMAGKSTYMRQVALIQILAQAGSFVPAGSASLPVVDRVFTRVGASDDIAGGQSTFMVEMTELSSILRSATEASLVLLDEVGRGTSTTDGLAIARAVTEHLHDAVGATTLFATHHHELTEAAADLPRARNLHFAADGSGGEVTFSHELREGAAGASYGVEVARSAGVPNPVVSRAHELLDAGERFDSNGHSDADVRTNGADEELPAGVRDRIEDADVATTTPMEALELLAELKRDLDD
ncbi:DNA mismatch repair protein MutS [Halorarius halobius]|uniref:DNA mismatch repair protein MutS n=1 Tax=Halorarius halobius TaxID=2962671 RepID=UPI0020CDE463|nr:DNA mismatch repair protein MutS [Halorarius halobius]